MSAQAAALHPPFRPVKPGFSWCDAATLTVVFLLYSNAVVVGVKFHGLPYMAGAVLGVLPLLLPVAYYLIVEGRPVVATPALPWVVLFLAVQTVGAMFSRDPVVAQGNLLEELQGPVLYILLINAIRSAATLRRVIWTLILVGSLLGGLSAFQQVTRTFSNDYGGFAQIESASSFAVQTDEGTTEQPRFAGSIGEKNRYAQIMLMLVPLAFMQFVGERTLSMRVLALLGTGLSAAGFVLAFSRGAAVAFVLVLGVMTVMGYVKARFLAVAVLGSLLMLAVFPQYRARLLSLADVGAVVTGRQTQKLDGAVNGRITEMLAAVRVYTDYPVVGVGPGMFKYYSAEYGNEGGRRLLTGNRQAHNLYLGIAAEYGTLGMVAFLAAVLVTLRSLSRSRRRFQRMAPPLAAAATGFVLVILTYLATGLSLHFSYSRYFWLVLALAGTAGMLTPGDPRASAPAERHATSPTIE